MQPRQTQRQDPARPLGLRFVVDAINAPKPSSSWSALTEAHGDPLLSELATQQEHVHAAVHALRSIFAIQDPGQAAAKLNQLLAECSTQPELAELPDGRWALRPSLTDTSTAATALTRVGAFVLATWLSERGRCAWGLCEATGCDRAFIDEGRRAAQRFCSTTCATRTRVALHRKSGAVADAGDTTATE
ncbi:CGNR zinc finger domain-containing protein [Leucobacter sp. NPDC015123]|uniref:CGNR zinc finger domain-containing protein n=1 Tax=Leucobacter sp. NPDC015123 TaxID=3364129 RepID=UPI0036F4A90A